MMWHSWGDISRLLGVWSCLEFDEDIDVLQSQFTVICALSQLRHEWK